MRGARGALAAGLVLAAAVPGALAVSAPAAAVGHRVQPGYPVSLAITTMTPQWARPGSVITVSGTVTNETRQPVSNVQVQLKFGSQPIAGPQFLQSDLLTPGLALGYQPITGKVTQPASTLAPGAAAPWSVTFGAKQMGMSAFGVYPLTAGVTSDVGGIPQTPVTVNAFLPYVPYVHGRLARAHHPPRQQIAWLWPLIDVPLVAGPGQVPCGGPAARALAASMAPGGRLNALLAAGQAHASSAQLTWAVDPALLADAAGLAHCPQATGRAAASWLKTLRHATHGQPLFATPYANVNLTLIGTSHADDVKSAFWLGRLAAGQVLNRNVKPSGTGQGLAAATAWPSGYYSPAMLQSLAEVDQISTFVLPSDALRQTPGSVFVTPVGAGTVRVLAAASPLTQLLGTASRGAASQFATANQFLAETALMAGQPHASPIVVAPPQRPQRWGPSAWLASTLLADTAHAPWLAPTSLASLAHGARATDRQLSFAPGGAAGSYSRRVLRAIGRADRDVRQIEHVQADGATSTQQPSSQAQLVVAALESADWARHSRRAILANLASLASTLESQHGIVIVADGRVTLGGLKGNVPVVIDNRLGYPVRVRLQASPAQPPGGPVTVQQRPAGLVLVPAHRQVETTLHVQATNVGSITITLRVLDQAGRPITGAQAVVTVQATQFGTFAMIILAAALGLFVLASATRGIRRGRPGSGGGDASVPAETEQADGSQQPTGADTVVSELGAASAAPRAHTGPR